MTLKEYLSNTVINEGIDYTVSISFMKGAGRQSLGDLKGTEISFRFNNEDPRDINLYQLMNVLNKDILDCEVVVRKVVNGGECYYIKSTQWKR
jgi:hypothetical protein